MMTKNKSKTRTFLKQLAIIPLFICFVFLFSTKITAQEKGASKALIDEYESKLHSPNGSVIVKGEDIKRLYYIYNLMSEEQKAKATKIPPPPPPVPDSPSVKGTTDVRPPQYSKPRKVYKDQKLDDVPQFPLSKDVIYFINGKKASLKQVKELSVDDVAKVDVVKKKGSKKSEIYITTKQ